MVDRSYYCHPYYTFVWKDEAGLMYIALYEVVEGKNGEINLKTILNNIIMLVIGKDECIFVHAVKQGATDAMITFVELRDSKMTLIKKFKIPYRVDISSGDRHTYVNAGKRHALYIRTDVADTMKCIRLDLGTGRTRFMRHMPRQVNYENNYWAITRIHGRPCMFTDKGIVYNDIFRGVPAIDNGKISFRVKDKKTGAEASVEWARQ